MQQTAVHHLLREIDRQILQRAELDSVLTYTCRQLVETFGLAVVRLGLKEADGSVRIRAQAGRAAATDAELPIRWDATALAEGPTGLAIRTGAIQQAFAADLDHYADDWHAWLRAHGIRVAVAFPLQSRGEIIGALSLYSHDPAAFDPNTLDLLARMAAQVAISILLAQDQDQIRLQTAALEAAANAVVITDRASQIVFVNPAFTALTGYAREEVIGQTPRVFKSGQHQPGEYAAMWQAILGGQVWHGELVNRRKNGCTYIEEQTITPVRGRSGEITHFVAIKQDVSERKAIEDQLRHMAMHDSLTGLPNRHALMRALGDLKSGAVGAVMLIDLDDFKAVNDSLGHAAGDGVLAQTAQLCRDALDPAHQLFRLGSDEFAVLLHGVEAGEAKVIADRLRRHISRGSRGRGPGISVGIAPIGAPGASALTLADFALHQAKDLGKNQTSVCANVSAIYSGLSEARWAIQIRQALASGGFELYYQPVVSVVGGSVEYREALLRMHHNGEVVLPSRFLPSAETYGLMPDIDRWVVGTVLAMMDQHLGGRVLVNLSGNSLSDESFRTYARDAVLQHPGVAGRLFFEITERSSVTDLPAVRYWMELMRERGCGFALDDFGTGYSSMAYLKDLPVDLIKIDGAFIRDIAVDPTNRTIVQALQSVASALGKRLIAESVETAETADVVRQLGIEFGQGLYWGSPHPYGRDHGCNSEQVKR